MVIDDEEDAPDDLRLADESDGVDEVIVVVGTGGVAAWHDDRALLQAYGVAGQCCAASDEDVS